MNGKVVVITGASSGIGAALALRLARDGHGVVLAARREQELKRVAAACGERALPVVADVTRRELVEGLREAALGRFGSIDVWVNNAGRGISRPVLELTDEDLDEMMAVNVKAALYGMQAILPYFEGRGRGHLVNVSSVLGRVPFVPFRSAYNAAKAALNALTANVRMDLRASHPGIHVSLVLPGVVTTDFARNARGVSTPSVLSPGTRAQTAEEVADRVAELIAHPVPEMYTNPAQEGLAEAYYRDVAAFEARGAPASGRP
jgi:NAD(P)-dependent dehydrogenase (short-subunit alcohol dehydrogenase family)